MKGFLAFVFLSQMDFLIKALFILCMDISLCYHR